MQGRKQLHAMVFPEGVYYEQENEGYQTTRINGFFALSSQISDFLDQKEKGKSDFKNHFSLSVVRRMELADLLNSDLSMLEEDFSFD